MNQTLTNRISMFKTVAGYLEQHNSVWSGMALFTAAVQEFEEMIKSVDAAAQKSEVPSAAKDEKAAARDSLEDVLFLTCEALGVLANRSNDHELNALTEVTSSTLARFTAEELVNRAELVLKSANSRTTELGVFQVTPANLDELREAVTRFKGLIEKPRMKTVERSTQVQSLPGLTRETSGLLRNRIDRMVNLFRRTHPEFVSGYRIARVIMNRAGGHSGPQLVSQPGTDATVH